MNDVNTDEETAKMTPIEDRDESLALMEPLSIRENDRHQAVIADLAIELTARSSGLRRSLPKNVTHALSDLVRSMNCYYSNWIEGHDTHPVDIERALNEEFSEDPVKRDLQLEARAHIAVQQWIDQSGLEGKATTVEGINGIHSRFCE